MMATTVSAEVDGWRLVAQAAGDSKPPVIPLTYRSFCRRDGADGQAAPCQAPDADDQPEHHARLSDDRERHAGRRAHLQQFGEGTGAGLVDTHTQGNELEHDRHESIG